MNTRAKKAIRRACPGGVLESRADRIAYSYDAKVTGGLPWLIVLPETSKQVADILRICSDYKIRVLPRGAGTGTTGASVPEENWLVLGFSRMNKILEINREDFYMRVQPGAVTADIQKAAEEVGLFYPPDPASARTCTIGGNVATGAGGLRAVKYGVTSDYILGLSACRIGGRPIQTGVLTRKGVVGYDLTRLLVGSEGTLAVVTEILLRLIAKPQERRTLLAAFNSVESACSAVQAILHSEVLPDAIELMDQGTIRALEAYGKNPFDDQSQALLLIEVDGPSCRVADDSQTTARLLRENGAVQVRAAEEPGESEALWEARRAVSPATFALAPGKLSEDVAVPVSRMAELIKSVREIAGRYNLRNLNYGHAGDGNLHVNLLLDDDPQAPVRGEKAVSEIFEVTLKLGGTISGEHGIGLTKRAYIAKELDAESIILQRAIKRLFDPDNLLNPGKTFPDPLDPR